MKVRKENVHGYRLAQKNCKNSHNFTCLIELVVWANYVVRQ